jgi:hypothetical protein
MAHIKECVICGMNVINESICEDCLKITVNSCKQGILDEVLRGRQELRDAHNKLMLADAAKLHGQPGCPTHGNSWCTCGNKGAAI